MVSCVTILTIKVQDLFIIPQNSLVPIYIQSPFLSSPRQPTICFITLQFCLSQNFMKLGVCSIWYFVSLASFPQHNSFEIIHAIISVGSSNNSFFNAWIHHKLFIQSPVPEHLVFFFPQGYQNKSAINILPECIYFHLP